ncbi:hypothetical protein GX563_05375 [Candidatus Bathyarchaeota archaeon]|nr:hypothetical protein [Candidatus Bathyarchaeota archaeon]
MTEINETEIEVSGESKFTKAMFLIISVFLIFVGPTYIPFLIADVANAGAVAADVVGFLLFLAGIGLLVFVLRKKLVT